MNAVQALELLRDAHPHAPCVTTEFGGLPYERVDTADRGNVPLPCGQLDFPLLWNTVFTVLPPGTEIPLPMNMSMRVVENGCGMYVVDVPETVQEVRKRFKRFYRASKGAALRYLPGLWEEEKMVRRVVESNAKRWAERGETSADVDLTVKRLLGTWDNRNVTFVFEDDEEVRNDEAVAIIETQVEGNVVHWVNTFMMEEHDHSGLGNACLLHVMESHCGHAVNLGIDIFEYKKLWKPRHVFAPGLEFV